MTHKPNRGQKKRNYTFQDYPYPQRVINTILEGQAKEIPDKVFLIYKGKEVLYKDLDEITNRVGNGFIKLGVKQYDNVCIILPNSLEYVYIWFGLNKIGAVEFPINGSYKGYLLQYLLNYSDSEILVVAEQFLPSVKAIEHELQKLKVLIVVSSGSENVSLPPKTRFETIYFEELLSASVPSGRPTIEVRYNDIMVIMPTSGTTGPSKGVMLSYNHEYNVASMLIKWLGYTPDDIFYNWSPFFHNLTQAFVVLPALFLGATVVIVDRFSATAFWKDIRKYNCTQCAFFGALITALLKQPPSSDDKNHGLRATWCIPITEEGEEFEKRFNIKLVECIGGTEVGIPGILLLEDRRPGSCGKASPMYEIKLFDDEDNEVPPGVVGEFVIRPKKPFIINSGYYKMPEATMQAQRNLWWHTGDLGRMDKEGYFYFVDRKKDALRRRGENISSFEVEVVINSHPSVLESACIAAPGMGGEDEVMVVVVLKPGEILKPEELIAFCEERMPYFQVPQYVRFVKSLPKTPNEKVQKHVLRSEGITPDTWDREKAGYKLKR